VGLQAF